jgi:hypothetical protein
MEHESALVRAFIVKPRQGRWLESLAHPKRRPKLLERLYHFRDLDPLCLIAIPPASHRPESIGELLAARGAPRDCHVISTNSELDGRVMPLADALTAIVAVGDGSLLSCIPGRLGYFEDESSRRYILSVVGEGSRQRS